MAVLEKINLEVRAGESIAITGRRGSGKSTLLNLLGQMYVADSGNIRYCGVNAGSMTMANRKSESLSAEDVTIKMTGYWTSPETGIKDLNAWHLLVPGHDLPISLRSYVKNHRWTSRFKYWERAVQVFDM